jgi:hypothetical protein
MVSNVHANRCQVDSAPTKEIDRIESFESQIGLVDFHAAARVGATRTARQHDDGDDSDGAMARLRRWSDSDGATMTSRSTA